MSVETFSVNFVPEPLVLWIVRFSPFSAVRLARNHVEADAATGEPRFFTGAVEKARMEKGIFAKIALGEAIGGFSAEMRGRVQWRFGLTRS